MSSTLPTLLLRGLLYFYALLWFFFLGGKGSWCNVDKHLTHSCLRYWSVDKGLRGCTVVWTCICFLSSSILGYCRVHTFCEGKQSVCEWKMMNRSIEELEWDVRKRKNEISIAVKCVGLSKWTTEIEQKKTGMVQRERGFFFYIYCNSKRPGNSNVTWWDAAELLKSQQIITRYLILVTGVSLTKQQL